MAVSYDKMNKALDKLLDQSPDFDEELVKYVDSCTINKPDGFDMYSWAYWGMRHSYDSVCAAFAGIYGKYRTFRQLQETT
jgi:hypothetical protein